MKTIMVSLLTILLATVVSAGDMGGSFRVGTDVVPAYDSKTPVSYKGVYTKLTLKYDYRMIVGHSIHGGWETHSIAETLLDHKPYRNIYWVGYKVTVGKTFIDLSHYCGHPVYAQLGRWNEEDNYITEGTILSIGIDF